jgi:hypothetical protein
MIHNYCYLTAIHYYPKVFCKEKSTCTAICKRSALFQLVTFSLICGAYQHTAKGGLSL